MPKNPVTDPINDQEIAFARLILSGTMNDRQAAEAVGLNPSMAAYTKSRPRVRAYLREHRAAVNEKLVDQEAEGQREWHLGRSQILTRLWELANLSPEVTKGSIAGQVRAMTMIVAIEGLLPGRRPSSAQAQPAPPPNPPEASVAKPMPQQRTTLATSPFMDSLTDRLADSLMHASSSNPAHSQPTITNPFIYPDKKSWARTADVMVYDVDLNPSGPFTLDVRRGAQKP